MNDGWKNRIGVKMHIVLDRYTQFHRLRFDKKFRIQVKKFLSLKKSHTYDNYSKII